MTTIESFAIFYFLSCMGCGLVLKTIFSDEELRSEHRAKTLVVILPIVNSTVVGIFVALAIKEFLWNAKRVIRKYLYIKYWTFILSEHIKFCILCISYEGEEKFRDEQVEKLEQIIKIAKS